MGMHTLHGHACACALQLPAPVPHLILLPQVLSLHVCNLVLEKSLLPSVLVQLGVVHLYQLSARRVVRVLIMAQNYTFMCVCVRARVRACVCACVRVCICMCMYIYVRMYGYTHVCMFTCRHTSMHTCMHV